MLRAALLLLAASHSTIVSGAITDLRVTRIDNGGIGDVFLDLADTYTLEFRVDFTGRIGAFDLIVELDEGAIVYHPGGNRLPQRRALLELSPTLEYDTFLTYGSVSSDEVLGVISLSATAGNGGFGPFPLTAEPQLFAAHTWQSADLLNNSLPDQSDFLIARLTLTNDAVGSFIYFGTTLASDSLLAQGRLPVIPEPDAIGSMLLGIAAARRTWGSVYPRAG